MHISPSSWNCLEYGHSYSIIALSSRWETAPRMRENQHLFYMGERWEQNLLFSIWESCSGDLAILSLSKSDDGLTSKLLQCTLGKSLTNPSPFSWWSRDLLWGERGHGSYLWPVFYKGFGKPVCKTSNSGVQVAQQTWKHQMVELPLLSWLRKCNPLG